MSNQSDNDEATPKDAPDIDLDNPPFPLTIQDRELLSIKDEDFHRISWSDLKKVIANNLLENLLRLPSDLRRYLTWSHDTKKQYGSIVNFVIEERLRWERTSHPDAPPTFDCASSVPFQDDKDYAVLINDWPYGLSEEITHLIVWSKVPIGVDPERGDLTQQSRDLINDFVSEHFEQDLEEEDSVLWFKNWTTLQSVRGVDHIHVLVRDAPEDVLKKWTERRDLK